MNLIWWKFVEGWTFLRKNPKDFTKNKYPCITHFQINCDSLEIKILCKFGENPWNNNFARAHTSNNSQNSQFCIKKNILMKTNHLSLIYLWNEDFFFIHFVSIRQRKKSIERTQAIILKIHSVQLKNKDFPRPNIPYINLTEIYIWSYDFVYLVRIRQRMMFARVHKQQFSKFIVFHWKTKILLRPNILFINF